MHAPYNLSTDDLGDFPGFCGKASILEADDFLRAYCRKAMTAKSYGLYFSGCLGFFFFNTWWTFRIFFVFFWGALGGSRGSPRRRPGGGEEGVFIENRRGGVSPGRERPKGPGGRLRRIGELINLGRGLNFFFFGPEMSTKNIFKTTRTP